jgi:hypothetical protein
VSAAQVYSDLSGRGFRFGNANNDAQAAPIMVDIARNHEVAVTDPRTAATVDLSGKGVRVLHRIESQATPTRTQAALQTLAEHHVQLVAVDCLMHALPVSSSVWETLMRLGRPVAMVVPNQPGQSNACDDLRTLQNASVLRSDGDSQYNLRSVSQGLLPKVTFDAKSFREQALPMAEALRALDQARSV